MATSLVKKRNIKYLNRDFDALKREFVEHIKVYFPDTYQDFNESSLGILLVELMAFVGDNFSFYLDKKFLESFLQTARERSNIFNHAKYLQFKSIGKVAATGVIDAYLKVPAKTENERIIPDMSFAGKVLKGAQMRGDNGESYETLVDIDFSTIDINNEDLVTVAETNPTTNQPVSFALRKRNVEIIAGQTKSATFVVGAYRKFREITLPEEDIIEVLNVTDSEGNTWYEVDYLAQDTVFDSIANTASDASEIPFILKLRSVPYRFVSEFNPENNRVVLRFGTGDANTFDGDLIPDLGDLALPLFGKDYFSEFSINPENFLRTRGLGLAPTNTTLTVRYRVGGGLNSNASANSISTVANSVFIVGDSTLDSVAVRNVGNTFAVLNPRPISGGREQLSIDEIKELASANFAAQNRIVTLADFKVRAMSMPSRFGSVFRANAKKAPGKNSVELVTFARNSSGHVTAMPTSLKKNLKTYLNRFRMATDGIDILDGEVINIGVNFNILTLPEFNASEVLADCLVALRDYFVIEKWQANQPINFTDLSRNLSAVEGVLSIIDITINNKVGTQDGRSYSGVPYAIQDNIKNNILYCRDNAIFEVKYPNVDINGIAR